MTIETPKTLGEWLGDFQPTQELLEIIDVLFNRPWDMERDCAGNRAAMNGTTPEEELRRQMAWLFLHAVAEWQAMQETTQ